MARRAAAVFLIALLQAAAVADAHAAERTPPRLLARPERFDDCVAEGIEGVGKFDDVNPSLRIEKDGTLGKVDLPENTPDWAKTLAGCVLAKLRFAPATKDGEALRAQAFLPIRFRERAPEEPRGILIDGIGSFITPPLIDPGTKRFERCFPRKYLDTGQTSRFVVSLVVQPDGTVTDLKMPLGSGPEHEKTARCMIEQLSFIPGTKDGQPVPAQSTLPIHLNFYGAGEMVPPELISTNADFEAAYQACIPRDVTSMGTATYHFTISTRGKVSQPKLLKSSGDPRLDEAGLCIVKTLRYKPMTQDGRAATSSITQELPMRPPR